ncbi:MAG: DUF3499 domain-containing protein [Micropruina sp.]
MRTRTCSRTGCSVTAVSTLTYAYADSTAVVGPLALRAEPGTYDLCRDHTHGLSAPRGWDVIRLPGAGEASAPSKDDLLALADAVREVGFAGAPAEPTQPQVTRRKGHLAVVADL